MSMSYVASRNLSKKAREAAERASQYVEADATSSVEDTAHDLVSQDPLLQEVLEASHSLDERAQERRQEVLEEGGAPRSDPVYNSLRQAREEAQEAVEERIEELVEEAVDSPQPPTAVEA